jgi:hypothetical protein
MKALIFLLILYTQKNLKKLSFIQSISIKWNCIDNTPTELFCIHLKDKTDTSCRNSFTELELYIDNYI